MNRVVLVTGATSGIGEACALKFADNGDHIIITGRRNERLKELESILRKKGVKTLSLNFDIRIKEDVFKAIDSLPEEWKNIDILVNNAGLSLGLDPIQDGDLQDWENMIDTNIKGLLYISKKIAPIMVERQKGHIINIGSIAGKEVYPNGNVYCATKHAVDAITKAMRVDMVKHGIKVTQIAPGAVETEFSIVRFHGDEEKAKNVYNGFEPLIAEDIAETVIFAANQPPHMNINDMLIMPTAQASSQVFHKKA